MKLMRKWEEKTNWTVLEYFNNGLYLYYDEKCIPHGVTKEQAKKIIEKNKMHEITNKLRKIGWIR